MSHAVYILSGSNVGDREANLGIALAKMELLPGLKIAAASAIYITSAQEMPDDSPSFMNQAVMVVCDYAPEQLLTELEIIEREMGRVDKGMFLPRIIDLDILLFGKELIETPRLTMPHPRLLQRPFALIPLLEISPDLTHPGTGRKLSEYLGDERRSGVVRFRDYVARNI